jgi:hypothetical protein
MDDLPLTELGDTERRLLSVLIRYDRDGRAFTTQSLAANAGVAADSWGLATALNNLAVRGLIKRGGGDPIPGPPSRSALPSDAASTVYRGDKGIGGTR